MDVHDLRVPPIDACGLHRTAYSTYMYLNIEALYVR